MFLFGDLFRSLFRDDYRNAMSLFEPTFGHIPSKEGTNRRVLAAMQHDEYFRKLATEICADGSIRIITAEGVSINVHQNRVHQRLRHSQNEEERLGILVEYLMQTRATIETNASNNLTHLAMQN